MYINSQTLKVIPQEKVSLKGWKKMKRNDFEDVVFRKILKYFEIYS